MADGPTRDDDALGHTLGPPAWMPRVGDVVAERFRVLGLLGAGGMGAVHRVIDLELDEEVALKLLRPEVAGAGDALARFRREVKLARRVTHPNVARTYDLGRHGATHFLTMELIEGESLARRLRAGGRPSLAEALRVAAEIARGLTAAHAVGVIHRDLKPDNVMLAGERVCLTDFGIARLAEAATGEHPTGGPIGTPAYMAPEQLECRELDGRADVYALGVLLFEALTGQLPFEGPSPLALAAARLTAEPRDPRALEPALPDGLAELVLAFLARAREQRPDAHAALARLDALTGGGGAPVAAAPRVGTSAANRRRVAGVAHRWVVAAWIEGAGDAAGLAQQLDEALDEAFVALAGFERVAPAAVRAARAGDASALARKLGADLVLHGTARIAGDAARVRLTLTERTDGRCLWQARLDGRVGDPFDLEDRVTAAVRDHLARQFTPADTPDRGPTSAPIRDVYRRARAIMLDHTAASYARGVALLEEALATHREDPWLMSQLAVGLARQVANPRASRDPQGDLARAEELVVRALATGSEIAEVYEALGTIRLAQGDVRRAVRGFREALARDPFVAVAHGNLARLLEESGRFDDAVERATLALRLEPGFHAAYLTLAGVAAHLGDADAFEEHLAAYAERVPVATVPSHLRMYYATAWRDAACARRGLEALDRSYDGPARAFLGRVFAHVLGDDRLSPDEVAQAVRGGGAPGRRMGAQASLVEAHLLALVGAPPEAVLDAVARGVPGTINLAMLDHDPLLAPVRGHARFARARAEVAARVADLWA